MTLREVTRTVISLVENTSGCPVVVSEDASLKTFAASRIARGANKIHSISFNPSAVSEPDYLICYQCGFILRLYGVATADRERCPRAVSERCPSGVCPSGVDLPNSTNSSFLSSKKSDFAFLR